MLTDLYQYLQGQLNGLGFKFINLKLNISNVIKMFHSLCK